VILADGDNHKYGIMDYRIIIWLRVASEGN